MIRSQVIDVVDSWPTRMIPAPIKRVKYGIVTHEPYGRSGPGTFDPDTRPMQDRPAGLGKGNTITIKNEWWDHIRDINSGLGFRYASELRGLWINGPYENKPAEAESIEVGGNFVSYDRETATHIHLVSYYPDQDVSALNPIFDNWYMKPERYFKALVISEDGRMQNPTVGGAWCDVYYPLIAKTELWMHKSMVELFPDRPDYILRGCNVYDGLQPLLTVNAQGVRTFHTDWRIKTVGVIPPKTV